MHALQVLEFESVLERLQSNCETAIGVAISKELRPSFDLDEVWLQLEETQEAHSALGEASPPSLGGVRDLKSALKRSSKGGQLGGEELYAIGHSLSAMRGMRSFLYVKRSAYARLWKHAEALPDLRKLEESLLDSLEANGDVRDGASPHLATLRQRKVSANQRLLDKIQSYTTGRTRDLLSDPIYTVRDGRFVIPLKAENRGKVRGIVHDTSSTGQTIFVEPEDVLQLGNALREIEAGERAEVQRIFLYLSGKAGEHAEQIASGLDAAGLVDFAFAKARLGYDMRGTMPEKLVCKPRIDIAGGKHPLLDPATAVPLDLAVGQESSVLITGPNTGGKTVAIKTVGMFVLMAQSGLMPPAIAIKLSPFTQVWADIGDEQSLNQSLSTFSGHIKNIAEALKSLRPGAIAFLDEIGAGTDPAEGASLAQSVLLEMQRLGACVLASTHYGELKAFAYETEGFVNAAMEFDTRTLQPTYKLRVGAAGASQALRIAERYGIPRAVVEKAREGLSAQHLDVALMLERLEEAQKLARQAQSEADKRTSELRKSEQIAARKLEEAAEIRQNVHAKANQVIEDALREIRLEATDIFEKLKTSSRTEADLQAARSRLKGLQEIGQDFAKEYLPHQSKPPSNPKGLVKGMSVRIDGMAQPGVLLEDPAGKQVQVQVGAMKMHVSTSNIRAMGSSRPPVKAKPNIGLQRTMNASTEIHLRAMRAENALEELEKFIDDAVLAGVPSVRIVHGKGEGILRKVTRETLRKHRDVASFRDGEPSEGGQGVTVAIFK